MVPVRLGVTRQDEMAPVGSGQMDIHHPDGGELLQYFPRRQARGMDLERFFRVSWRQ